MHGSYDFAFYENVCGVCMKDFINFFCFYFPFVLDCRTDIYVKLVVLIGAVHCINLYNFLRVMYLYNN